MQVLYKDLDCGVDCDSRIALVGANGSGKSTLLKMMAGELTPTLGTIGAASGLVRGHYHQHSAEALDLSMTPLDYFRQQFPNERLKKIGMPPMEVETWRAYLGQVRLITPIGQHSSLRMHRIFPVVLRSEEKTVFCRNALMW